MSSWTLYFIYYKSFNTNINRLAGVFFFAGWKYGKKGLSAVKFNRSFCST